MKKVALHTLGCKLNYAETSTIRRQFAERGFDIVEFDQPSDVYVLNTCSVTERADKECRQIIRRALRQSPYAYVIVVGCYAQLQPEEIASIDGVDLVLGTKEKFRVFEHAVDFTKRTMPQVFVSCIDEVTDFTPAFSAEAGGRTRAFLKVQDGCDFHCTFCTIPLARGESRSQPIESVLRQAEQIVSQRYKEIVLTGVNVGDYGKKNGHSLLELLQVLEGVDGIERIRISSIEPNLLTREMVKYILSSEKLCNHFHIPLQSGSDTILKAMRRRYTTRDYRNLIEYIKAHDPDAGIGVDVITGFPGETDALFNETYMLLVDLPISYLHVFTYSERPGTLAVEFENHVDPRARFERSEMLRILGQKKRHAFYSSFVGQTMPVLYESTVHHGRISGLTTNYARVESSSHQPLSNEIYQTTLTAIDGEVCIGRLAESAESAESIVVQQHRQGEMLSINRATAAFSSRTISQHAELP
ncbi:MAG: tRNA (N(6)-L-threonylcarbamoyladenosine(37)-C(2))-methylthiotransferase MtaB [Ignavibacteriae bacterium]|nr:tRNA (N(6)-L-threonylcarbamoyladenosine(37)-C(2))-methylthiotransferase MtaB [Ignavibacteriota bacterium]